MSIRLKKNKDRPIRQRHHWVYSGAIESHSPFQDGDLTEVFSYEGEKLGMAIVTPGRSIFAHMLSLEKEPLKDALCRKIKEAVALRKKLFSPGQTNAFRLIHAEGDGIPGLIVDAYADVLVMQIAHPGLEKMKADLIEMLLQEIKPRSLFEKSTSFLRKKEGLSEIKAHRFGDLCSEVEVIENHLRYELDVLEGQKTGLFLDQREMRALVQGQSKDRKVLNCFAYTGGFSIAALAGKALFVDSVEISAKCEKRIEKNLQLNGLENHRFFCEDVFDFVQKSDLSYDLIILDPPAFVKKREDVAKAFYAYKDLNRHVMSKMGKQTFLLTSSCSYHIDESLFQNILFRAAFEAKRSVRILERHRLAHDHPISLFHPESAYLKSFFLFID